MSLYVIETSENPAEIGRLICRVREDDEMLDDDPSSPTEGQYLRTYYEVKP